MNIIENIIRFTTVLSELTVGSITRRVYRAVVKHNRTLRLEDIVESAATKHGVQRGLMAYHIAVFIEEVIEAVKTGHRVEIADFLSAYLSASGTFEAANSPWNALLHRLCVNLIPKGRLKAATEGATAQNVTEGNHVIVRRILDGISHVENVITNVAGVKVYISGDCMQINPGAEDEGVWLEREDGSIAAKATVDESTTTTVDCTFGTLPVEDGKYKLVVAARGGLGLEYGVSLARRNVEVKTANS